MPEVPKKYRAADMIHFEKRVVDAVMEMMEGDDSPGLLVFGNVGTGKTHLCYAISYLVEGSMVGRAVDWITDFRADACGRPPKHFEAPKVTQRYNPAIYIAPKDPPTVMERAEAAPLVLIDDLGAHRPMDFAEEQIYSLIDFRTAHERPIVVTTNLTRSQLTDRNPRVADRLRYLNPVGLTGESRRQ